MSLNSGSPTGERIIEQKKEIVKVIRALHPDPGMQTATEDPKITQQKHQLLILANALRDMLNQGGQINEYSDWPSTEVPDQIIFPAIRSDQSVVQLQLTFKDQDKSPAKIFAVLKEYTNDPLTFVNKYIDSQRRKDVERERQEAERRRRHEENLAAVNAHNEALREHQRRFEEETRRQDEFLRQQAEALHLSMVEAELRRLWEMKIIHLPQLEDDRNAFKKFSVEDLSTSVSAIQRAIQSTNMQWLLNVADLDESRIDIRFESVFYVRPRIEVLTRNSDFYVEVVARPKLNTEEAERIFTEINARIKQAMNPGDYALLKIRSMKQHLQDYRVRCGKDFDDFAKQSPLEAEYYLTNVEKFARSTFEKRGKEPLTIAAPATRSRVANYFRDILERRAVIRNGVLYADKDATNIDMLSAIEY